MNLEDLESGGLSQFTDGQAEIKTRDSLRRGQIIEANLDVLGYIVRLKFAWLAFFNADKGRWEERLNTSLRFSIALLFDESEGSNLFSLRDLQDGRFMISTDEGLPFLCELTFFPENDATNIDSPKDVAVFTA